nr:Gag-Pol polyprotein [Tanacetum cinerariifolium]
IYATYDLGDLCIVTHQMNIQFLLQLKSKWQRFMTIVKQSQDLKNNFYHKLYDVLKQHQNEVNEIRAERLAVSDKEVTPRDKEIKKLVDLISMSYTIIYKPTNNNLKTSSNTKNKNVDNTLRFDTRIGYDKQTGKYENQRAVNVSRARDNVGTQVVQHSGIQCFKCKEFGHVVKECKKVKQYEILLSTRKRYFYDDRNITSDSSDMYNDQGEVDQDTTDKEERILLTSLIANLKLEIVENKKINKDLKKENMSLNSELTRYKESDYVKESNIEIANAYGLLKEQKYK